MREGVKREKGKPAEGKKGKGKPDTNIIIRGSVKTETENHESNFEHLQLGNRTSWK